MKRLFLNLLIAAVTSFAVAAASPVVISVKAPAKGSANKALAKAIGRASRIAATRQVVISLEAGATYHLTRAEATPLVKHVSNTTSADENPDPTKHIAMLFDNLTNVTLEGNGARFVTHGELTPWAITNCRGVTLRNFSIDAADPSVAEMTVGEVTDSTLTARIHSRSRYDIDSRGKLHFRGEGWQFTDGIAQIFNPESSTTLRTSSPIADALRAEETAPGIVKFYFSQTPRDARPGCVYQMRHSIRNEVAGLIELSDSIRLCDIRLNFMGNFGIVAQNSSRLTYSRLTCAPDLESQRTAAGFADFLQVSGCRGKVTIDSCRFAGSHDDPINIHGTHMRIVGSPSPSTLRLRYMHPQTWGFPSFFAGDTINITDSHTLLPVATAVATEASMAGDYEMIITLDRNLPDSIRQLPEAVVENVSATPSVSITRCLFTLTPTRGVLVTTRRPVVIDSCEFLRCPMSAVLIADDARSWYESGPVRDVTIRNCRFVDCANPVIWIAPENDRHAGAVHSGITIENNTFENASGKAAEIRARSVGKLTIRSNSGPLSTIID